MAKKTRNQIIEDTVHVKEKGYVNNPDDSGGETMYGITRGTADKNKSLWAKHGWDGVKMQELPLDLAYDIYVVKYWNEMSLDLVWEHSDLIAEELFDSGVNMGTYYPQEWLQRCLNVLNNKQAYYKDIGVDGDIGYGTATALEAYIAKRGKHGVEVLYSMLNNFQGVYYVELAERREKDEAFVYGWHSQRIVSGLKENL